ncbi:Cuticlin-1, partial [Frankliniella fusca]
MEDMEAVASTRGRGARAGSRHILLPLLVLQALQALQPARAQPPPPAACPPEHDIWVKMTALMPATLAPHYRVFMYSSPGNAVTAECYNRCRESGDCRAFLVDHARSACFRVSHQSPVSWDQPGDTPVAAAPASTYFERACLNVRGSRCASRAWAAERVPGYELVGWDRLTIASPVSRTECLQECIKPHDGWECRSARWDSRTGACYLSAEDRRSQPDSFRAGPWGVEYLENECAEPPASASSCAYQEFANVSMVIADLQITGLDREQCQARCEAETNFRCRGFSLRPPVPGRGAAWTCVLHGDDTISAGPSALYPLPGALYAERAACIDLRVSCSRRHMTVTLQSAGPFQGRLFVLGRSDLCGAEGRGSTSTSLTLPLDPDPDPARLPGPGPGVNDRCGLRLARAFGRGDGDANRTLVSAVVVVQRNPIIQTRGDRAVRVGCILAGEDGPPQNLTLGASIAVANPEVDNNGTAVLNVSSSAPTVRLRITDLSGREQPLHETQLGDTLQLRIDVTPDTSPWGVRATHLVASSADGQDSYLLLDSRGCPPDPHTFPGLRPVEPGARSLAATFRAFKFPSSALVRFGLKVHFCRGGCAPVNCGAGIASSGRRRRAGAGPATSTPAVPEDVDYPMQLAIVVHTPRVLAANAGASASGIITIDSVNQSDGRVEEMVCMTGGALVGLAAGALLLQAVILVVCCVGARRHIASHEKQMQAYTNPAWSAASIEDRRKLVIMKMCGSSATSHGHIDIGYQNILHPIETQHLLTSHKLRLKSERKSAKIPSTNAETQQSLLTAPAAMPSQSLPVLYAVERLLVGNIVHEDEAHGAPVMAAAQPRSPWPALVPRRAAGVWGALAARAVRARGVAWRGWGGAGAGPGRRGEGGSRPGGDAEPAAPAPPTRLRHEACAPRA